MEGTGADDDTGEDAGKRPPRKNVYQPPVVTRRKAAAVQPPQTPAEPSPPADVPGPQPSRPDPVEPWPSSPRRPQPHRVWPRNLAAAVLAGAIAGGVAAVPKLASHHTGTASVPFGGQIPGQAGSLTPISATTPKVYANPDDRYFDGSPSFAWANGVAGIVEPQPVPVGGFSAQTVGGAYDGLRGLLIAADLDPGILAGGDPTTYFDLVDPLTKGRARYDAAAAHPNRLQHTPLSWVTRFDPQRTQLLGKTVKVQGTMTASTDAAGHLHVVADYRFVYAVAPVGSGDANNDRSMVHRLIEVIVFPSDRGYQTTPGTHWLGKVTAQTSNDLCGLDNGFVNPGFGTGDPSVRGTTVDPYSGSLPTGTTPSTDVDCHPVRRV